MQATPDRRSILREGLAALYRHSEYGDDYSHVALDHDQDYVAQRHDR